VAPGAVVGAPVVPDDLLEEAQGFEGRPSLAGDDWQRGGSHVAESQYGPERGAPVETEALEGARLRQRGERSLVQLRAADEIVKRREGGDAARLFDPAPVTLAEPLHIPQAHVHREAARALGARLQGAVPGARLCFHRPPDVAVWLPVLP